MNRHGQTTRIQIVFLKTRWLTIIWNLCVFFLLLVKAESSSTQLCLSKKITYPIPVIYHFFLSKNKVSFGGHIGQTQFPTAAHIFHPPSRWFHRAFWKVMSWSCSWKSASRKAVLLLSADWCCNCWFLLTRFWLQGWKRTVNWLFDGTHRIHGAAIYGNMDPINIPPLC